MERYNEFELENKREHAEKDASFQLEFEIEELESRISFVVASLPNDPSWGSSSGCPGSSSGCHGSCSSGGGGSSSGGGGSCSAGHGSSSSSIDI